MVKPTKFEHFSTSKIVLFFAAFVLTCFTGCAKNSQVSSQVEHSSQGSKFFSIPGFDGGENTYIAKDEITPKTQNNVAENGANITSINENSTKRYKPLDDALVEKCVKVYELEAKEKLECLAFYQQADARLQELDQTYDENRFFPVPDELGNYQNLNAQEVITESHAVSETDDELNNQPPFILDYSNKEMLNKVDLSELTEGAIVKSVRANKPLAIDFDEQNATIRLRKITRPYVIVKVDDLSLKDDLIIDSLIDRKVIIPQVIALNELGQAVAELRHLTPEYQAETLIKYAKLRYTVSKQLLPADIKYLLIYAGTRKQLVKNQLIKPSMIGRLVFRRF